MKHAQYWIMLWAWFLLAGFQSAPQPSPASIYHTDLDRALRERTAACEPFETSEALILGEALDANDVDAIDCQLKAAIHIYLMDKDTPHVLPIRTFGIIESIYKIWRLTGERPEGALDWASLYPRSLIRVLLTPTRYDFFNERWSRIPGSSCWMHDPITYELWRAAYPDEDSEAKAACEPVIAEYVAQNYEDWPNPADQTQNFVRSPVRAPSSDPNSLFHFDIERAHEDEEAACAPYSNIDDAEYWDLLKNNEIGLIECRLKVHIYDYLQNRDSPNAMLIKYYNIIIPLYKIWRITGVYPKGALDWAQLYTRTEIDTEVNAALRHFPDEDAPFYIPGTHCRYRDPIALALWEVAQPDPESLEEAAGCEEALAQHARDMYDIAPEREGETTGRVEG